MNSQVSQDTPLKPGQPQPQPQPPEREGDQGKEGEQPKPEIPNIPEEMPKREIDRKPSDPKSVPNQGPEQGPKKEMPDKEESEENNDVEEKSPDLLVEDDRDANNESLVDSRDRFPFPNKETPYKKP